VAYTHGIGFFLALVLVATPAMAQPGQTPAPQAPQAYRPQPAPVQVTPDEYELLLRGEISQGQHVGGGILGTWLGLGIGHAVQERWTDKGWIFTVGESIGFTFMMAGLVSCIDDSYDYDGTETDCHEGYFWGGLFTVFALRIWEIVDVWAYPPHHNRRVRELRARVYGPAYYQQYQQPPPPPPVYMRAVDGGFTGGITVRF
jgi:hypothetical protein